MPDEDAMLRGRRPDDGERSEDAELLLRYADEKSEEAFAELVRRHLDLVYSVALRQVGGDAHLAEDVAQVVFMALARKAASLAARPVLGGWLYRTTQFAAIDVMRAESRRRVRESEAQTMHELTTNPGVDVDWEKLRPTLDQAIGELKDDDRDAVVLRFFEGKSFADVGAKLRLTENAARMRVERALDKLHTTLARRGVTSTAAGLAVALANQPGVAAPAGLAASVTGTALAGAVTLGSEAGATIGAGILSLMSTTKFIIASATVVAAVAIGVAVNQVREARATGAELAAAGQQQAEMQARLRSLEGKLAAAEQRAQTADADAARLLKAVQAASPAVGLPPGDATGIAFVIDTSGSMRNPKVDGLWSAVFQSVSDTLAAHPEVRFLLGYDTDGRIMFSAGNQWLPRTPEALQQIEQVLRSYNRESVSSPLPGIFQALRLLPLGGKGGAQLHVCVIGDELATNDMPSSVLRQLDALNPADAAGTRRATISAIQLPTTVREKGGEMANTGKKFQALMTEVTKGHGGTFKLLDYDALH